MPKVYLTEREMFQLGCHVGHWPSSEWAPPGKTWNWGLPSGPPFIESDPNCEGWAATKFEALSEQEKHVLAILNPYRCKTCDGIFSEEDAEGAQMRCHCGGKLKCVREYKPHHSRY